MEAKKAPSKHLRLIVLLLALCIAAFMGCDWMFMYKNQRKLIQPLLDRHATKGS